MGARTGMHARTLSFLAISSNLAFSLAVTSFQAAPSSLPMSPKPASGLSFFTCTRNPPSTFQCFLCSQRTVSGAFQDGCRYQQLTAANMLTRQRWKTQQPADMAGVIVIGQEPILAVIERCGNMCVWQGQGGVSSTPPPAWRWRRT